jgi:PAT family beta-lactamase induction signal transducer AmpG
MSKMSRYIMFALLYFAQGAVLSYFTSLNSLYLLSFNLDMGKIGIISSIAMIPFVIKIFLGMLSDKVNIFGWGHRKPFIIIGLFLQALCLLFVPLVNPATQYALFAALALILMTGMAMYDTCTVGLALDSSTKEEEGTIQGFMVGGRAMGVVLISSVIGLLVERTSWSVAFYMLAVLTLAPLPLVLRVKEAPRRADQTFAWKAFRAFTVKPVIMLGVLGALYSLVIYGANQIVNPFLQAEFNISTSMAGFVTTVWGIGVVFGSVTGGRLTDKWGQRTSVLRASMLSLVSVALIAFIRQPWQIWPLVLLFGLAFGFYETVFFAISMDRTDPRIAASMFSILMAIANIGTGIGLALTGGLVEGIGYPATFIVLALLNILIVPLLPHVFVNKEELIVQVEKTQAG